MADTRNKVTEVVEEIDAFIDELEDEEDTAKKAKWNNEMKNMLQELKANEKEVKQVMKDLLLDNPNDIEVLFRGVATGPGVAQGQVGPLPAVHLPAERDQLRLDQELQRDVAKVNQKRLIIIEKADEMVSLIKNISRIDGGVDDVRHFLK